MNKDHTVSAYPNFAPDSIYIKPVYNLNKWLDAMRELYTKLHIGTTYKESFGQITSGWDTVESRDFETWLSYYQSGNQSKYKKAQFYVNDNIPGYFIPNEAPARTPIIPDMDAPATAAQQKANALLEQENKRKTMEEQRRKIIGRLNAAIKYLTSPGGYMLAGAEFDKLLAAMYELVKQIQTVNKISLSNQLYYDLIIRQANKLSVGGFERSATFLKKFAQNAPAKNSPEGPIPIASQSGSAVPGTLTNDTPPVESLAAPIPEALAPDAESTPAIPPGAEPTKPKDPLDELLDNLNTAGITDSNFSDEQRLDEVSLDEELSVEAQLAPSAPEQTEPPQAQPPSHMQAAPGNDDMEVTLPNEPAEDTQAQPDQNIDDIINSALSHITIQDVVRKIEDVNAIFQNRTIARELSIIDLMLSNLGLSSYFNNLSEIIQKNHEASNYSISRLSDILTKLRGAVSNDAIEATKPTAISPETQRIQERLKQQKVKDEDRKEMRKQLQEDALEEEIQDKRNPQQSIEPQLQPNQEIAQAPAQIV